MVTPPPKHLISIDSTSDDFITEIFTLASQIKKSFKCGPNSVEWEKYSQRLKNQMMFTLFYEPSTRTRFSFETAMQYLGGLVTTTEAAKLFSSVAKGETLSDTIRTCARYGINRSVIVLRHSEKGSSYTAAQLNVCSIINAGDGTGEHPTQALLDMYTIQEQFGSARNLTLTLVGDLQYGRTVHSLLKLALRLGIVRHIHLVAPKGLELPPEYCEIITRAEVSFDTATSVSPTIIKESDVVYITRVQRERLPEGTQIKQNTFTLTSELAQQLKETAIVLHPLPRNEELPTAIDALPQARFFDQVENGLYIRMAILILIFRQ